MEFITLLILFAGTFSMTSRADAEDLFPWYLGPFQSWRHKALRADDTPISQEMASLSQKLPSQSISTILLPLRSHKPPVQIWSLRITSNPKKPNAPQNGTQTLQNHTTGIDSQNHKAEVQGSDDISVHQLLRAFPFLWELMQHHIRSDGRRHVTAEEPRFKVYDRNGVVVIKRNDINLLNKTKKQSNLTMANSFVYFTRVKSIDWGSVILHMIFIITVAFLITMSISMCHTAVTSIRGKAQDTTFVVDSLKKVKLVKNSGDSNMC